MNKYILVKKIGTGAYGSVWKAKVGETGKFAAVKIMTKDEKMVWKREVKILEKIKPICSSWAICYEDSWINDKKYYIATNFIQGKNLFQLISTTPLEKRNTNFQIIHDLIIGINKIHSLNIAHQDIKESNIMFDKTYKYIDFGYSTIETNNPARGTEYIAPPERINDETKWLDLKAQDYWAVGILILRWYTLEWREDYYSYLNEELYDEGYELFPHYSDFSLSLLKQEIDKIQNFGVRCIVGLLLEHDPIQRDINFQFVLRLINEMKQYEDIDMMELVEQLLLKTRASIDINTMIPTLRKILEFSNH